MPDLTPEEYENLKTDIQVNGVQIPVEVDEEDNILDGYHRAKICLRR
jgi:ParB-like chromosome segregation protein Spo0J